MYNLEQRIFIAAKEEGVPSEVAEIMVSQAKHETGNFSSNVFATDNNAFGMKMPSKRDSPFIAGPSTIVMTSEGAIPYAHYDSVENSARDMVHWLEYQKADFKKINTPEKYAAFLKSRGYYGASQDLYTNALVGYYHSAKKAIGDVLHRNSGAVVISGITLLGMLVYFVARVAKSKKS